MNGKTDKEIEEERLSIVSKISETARGCIIEHSCAVAYMVKTIIAE
jgi:hypothetical protein